MAGAIIVLLIVAIVIGVAINAYLRSWVKAESRLEAHMHDPHTHVVEYAVPEGVDPATIRFELARAGFNTGIGSVGEAETLLVECERSQRERVRSIIEGVHTNVSDGSAPTIGHVVFEDER